MLRRGCARDFGISIHALREEGDQVSAAHREQHGDFYPRPPRGGRPFREHTQSKPLIFLSTPSARRATQTRSTVTPRARISIHALREEGDQHGCRGRGHCVISIHALREEGDYSSGINRVATVLFLSTPSARRATPEHRNSPGVHRISIHALREEGDLKATRSQRPAGVFLSTPSARRATAKTETKSLFSNKLYNILHEFRRALIYNGSKNYPNHAK